MRGLRVIEYTKNAPNWGDTLKQTITRSIKETLEAPLEFVLPTFLEVDETAKAKKVSRYEKELLGIRQEIELVRRELRASRVGAPSSTTALYWAGAEKRRAVQIIAEMLDRGADEDTIFKVLVGGGIGADWIREVMSKYKQLEDFG